MMATLVDPAVFDNSESIAERLEAVARSVMAARCRLKQKPGTHSEQADLVAELDHTLDWWNNLTCRVAGHQH